MTGNIGWKLVSTEKVHVLKNWENNINKEKYKSEVCESSSDKQKSSFYKLHLIWFSFVTPYHRILCSILLSQSFEPWWLYQKHREHQVCVTPINNNCAWFKCRHFISSLYKINLFLFRLKNKQLKWNFISRYVGMLSLFL
jgi:hypothetical protein